MVAFASTETLQYAMDVNRWMALEAVLFLVYLPTLSITESNDGMMHDELDGMKKALALSCSVNVTPWRFPTGTAYIHENVSRDSQSLG